jgi:hypothetical protein
MADAYDIGIEGRGRMSEEVDERRPKSKVPDDGDGRG